MISSKHDYVNYDQFFPNFSITCNNMQFFFVPNLKSFGPIQAKLWAKEVWEFSIMLYGFFCSPT